MASKTLYQYIGGKTRIVQDIIRLMPEHQLYVEVFAGAASVFFHKSPSKIEVVNDLSKDIATTFRVVQNHPEELIRQFVYQVRSRDEFDRMVATDPNYLTDIQRAARWIYLQRVSYGGKPHGRIYYKCVHGNPHNNYLRIESVINAAWERLNNVQIECMDFRELIPAYDQEQAFFYLDPPYWERVIYQYNFKEQDFVDLADILCNIKGKFLLSINDCPEIRRIFAGFAVAEINFRYSIVNKDGKQRNQTELLIKNY